MEKSENSEKIDRTTLLGLRKFLAPEFVYGPGARKLVARFAKNFSLQKVLLVSDPGVCATGWPAEIQAILGEAGIPAPMYTDVSANPRDHEVMRGAKVFQEADCTGLVAVGGGSVIDCAKGIGIVLSNGGHILDYVGVDRIERPSPPLVCIPTTQSASDLSPFAVISNPADRSKQSIISKALIPDISLIDPETLRTLGKTLGCLTSIDSFTQALEALASNANSVFTDLLALEAVRLASAHLPGGNCPETMLASIYSGLAFSNASLGLVHAMAHALGGWTDWPHGECVALLHRPVMEFNYPAARKAYERFGEMLGVKGEEDLLERIEALGARCGSQNKLSERGIARKDLPELAARAYRDPCAVTNPRPATAEQIEGIYERIF